MREGWLLSGQQLDRGSPPGPDTRFDRCSGRAHRAGPRRSVGVTRNDEVGQLADAFRRMAAALEIEASNSSVLSPTPAMNCALTSLRMAFPLLNDADELQAIIEGRLSTSSSSRPSSAI